MQRCTICQAAKDQTQNIALYTHCYGQKLHGNIYGFNVVIRRLTRHGFFVCGGWPVLEDGPLHPVHIMDATNVAILFF